MADDTRTEPPIPDPTLMTTEQLLRAVAAERDYVNGQLDVLRERLSGIDRATQLLNETVNRVPTDVTQQVRHLRELHDEKFESVAVQFRERDTRQERESRDNKVAVDAAFAAQKEAASEQNKSNTLAISKSEAATTETISKLAELFRTEANSLAGKIDDLKERVLTIESLKRGGNESRAGLYALIGAGVALLGIVVVVSNLLTTQ